MKKTFTFLILISWTTNILAAKYDCHINYVKGTDSIEMIKAVDPKNPSAKKITLMVGTSLQDDLKRKILDGICKRKKTCKIIVNKYKDISPTESFNAVAYVQIDGIVVDSTGTNGNKNFRKKDLKNIAKAYELFCIPPIEIVED